MWECCDQLAMPVTAVEGASIGGYANLDGVGMHQSCRLRRIRHQQGLGIPPSKGPRLLQVPSEKQGARGWRESPMAEEPFWACPLIRAVLS